jgi:sugar lactone lactonase YvrE
MKSETVQTRTTGIAMGESPRWHEGRLWFSDWGLGRVLALDLKGNVEIMVQGDFGLPFSIDWLPDGRLLIVAGRKNELLCQDHDGTLTTYADLTPVSDRGWNEIVVDGRGNIYVNGFPGVIAVVRPNSPPRQVAEGIAFPNGMAVTPDNETLIIAESHGKCLTAFQIEQDGSLTNRRIWAALDGPPDGICIDSRGAVWYADVPNKRCVRVREGGEILQQIELDLGCFACMLGGESGRELFIVANEWRGMEKIAEVVQERTGRVFSMEVEAQHAGWPRSYN